MTIPHSLRASSPITRSVRVTSQIDRILYSNHMDFWIVAIDHELQLVQDPNDPNHRAAQKEQLEVFAGQGYMQGRVVIPIHDEDGRLVAYAGRSVGQTEPRYRFPPRFRKSLVLFNLHRSVNHGKTVVVVEGFFDCLN